jgi:hypothetical protein
MADQAFSAYLSLTGTTLGRLVLAALSLGVLGALVQWARSGEGWQRWPVFITACILTAVVTIIYGIALAANWWTGDYFQETPLLLQLMLLVPLTLLSWLIWLTGYGWLVTHTRHPVLIYGAVAILLIGAAIVADRAEISGGLVLVAADGEVWKDAVVGIGLMFVPILIFEGVRQALQTDALP